MYRGCCAAVAEVLSLVLTKYPRGVRGDCVLQHHQLHQHIDKALRVMRNNYNLFAHHSKTENWKKEEVSVSTLSVLDTNAAAVPSVPAHPLQKCRFQLFTQWRMWPLMMTTEKARKKKAATLALFICILQWARDSLRVGKISKSASLTAMRHFGLPSWAQRWAWRWRWRRSWCRWVAATTSRDGDWCSEWTKLPKQSDWQHLLLPSKRPGVAWLASSSSSPSDWLLF